MRHHYPVLILAGSLSGCLIHDNDCWEDGAPGHGNPGSSGSDTGGDTGSEAVAPAFLFTPDEVVVGQSVIVSLEADQDFDFSTIINIEFYGDITICTRQDRADELLLSLVVGADADLGAVDAILEFSDGTATWLDDGLTIVSADGTTDDGTSGGDGTDDGSGGGTDSGTSGGTSGGTDDGSGSGGTQGSSGC